ncbi:MAG: hypothetical protein OEY22_04895 [Candidatus Bathyarchaeota archaeon]|nr:hypothetical protein [Candidatus Bathyarchaeota archaeon]MDH5788425.1 hypothetical protein [Candidatus Bathyarchaeota archaeon]
MENPKQETHGIATNPMATDTQKQEKILRITTGLSSTGDSNQTNWKALS